MRVAGEAIQTGGGVVKEQDVAGPIPDQELGFFRGGFLEVCPEVSAFGPVAPVDAVRASEAPNPEACTFDDGAAGNVGDLLG